MKKNVLMNIRVVASFLLVATLGQVSAYDGCDFKIDAINNQALSLKDHCASIKEFVECMSTNCCGGSCPCAPTSIVDAESAITQPGMYCVTQDILGDVAVETDNAIIDLNGHVVSTLILGNNCVVKNGTVNQITIGTNDAVSNVKVPSVIGDGAGSSVALVDVTGLTSVNSIERVVMARCTGDGVTALSISSGVRDITLYDSAFPSIFTYGASEQLAYVRLYRTLISGEVTFSLYVDVVSGLQEFDCYQSVIGGRLQFHAGGMPLFEKFLLEESQVGRIELASTSKQSFNTLIERSIVQEALLQKCSCIVINQSQFHGTLGLFDSENVKISNVSNSSTANAFSVAGGKNILLTDCCATAQDQTGYVLARFGGGDYPQNVNLIGCFAKGCADGFTLTGTCLIKDCVCDGATGTSFTTGGGSDVATLRAVGNVAVSVASVPVTNYSPMTDPFNIDANTIINAQSVSTAENTLERSAWRNMSFELSIPTPP